MKIAVISSSAPLGKGESFVISEANAMAADGHQVLLIPTQLRRGNPNRFELQRRVSLCIQPSFSLKVIFGFCCYSFRFPKRLFSLFQMVTDRRLWNSIKNYLVLPKAIWLSGQLKKKNIEHIHSHWLTTSATLAMVCSYLTKIPWSCTAHRGDIVSDNLLEEKCTSAAFIRFISQRSAELAKSRVEIAKEKIHVLHLGVALIERDSHYSAQSSERPFTIVCPANLVPVKGHDYLINAISKMERSNHVQLILAGDGVLRNKLEEKTRKLGIQNRVHFKGHVPHSELLSWYKNKQVDLVVLPSLDLGNDLHEGIPVSLMEAMLYEIPVISTRTGGIPELLEEQSKKLKFGVMVDAGDSEGLAFEIDLMVKSPDARKYWSKMGSLRIEEAFNQQKVIKSLLRLISDSGKCEQGYVSYDGIRSQ